MSDPLDALHVVLVQEFVRRERRRRHLLSLVLLDFEHAPTAKVRRGRVHKALAARLNRSVSNELCLEAKGAIFLLPGVHELTANGHKYYRGLRPRLPSTLPSE